MFLLKPAEFAPDDHWSHRTSVSIRSFLHRQGYDLQLTQYDERGGRADELDGHGMGADAVAGPQALRRRAKTHYGQL